MNDQKRENLLNLALDATESEREKSLNLNVGYNEAERQWTLIIKYTGSLDNLRNMGVGVTELLNNYAVLTSPERLIDQISDMENVIYIEKPKRLNFSILNSIASSCINPAREEISGLYGKGVTIAVIDSGIDYRHPVFKNADGATRLVGIFDQSADRFYDRNAINEALENPLATGPKDASGHGTAVASVAAGNFAYLYGEPSGNIGIATEADILAVKLGYSDADSFPRTSELMKAVDFCVRYGVENNSPMVINLSFGNNYGSHDGNSLLETFLDEISGVGITTIVAGSGNEGGFGIHTSGFVALNQTTTVELAISPYEPSLNLQIWKNYGDIFDITLVTPSGRRIPITEDRAGTYRYGTDGTEILIYYGEASPFSQNQEIYIDFIPNGSFITEGIWQILLSGRKISWGGFDMWLPSAGILNGSRFLTPTPDTTITIPATARKLISVGAYNSYNTSFASFSGRGCEKLCEAKGSKPDIVAPGVNISAAAAGGGLINVSGTSFAAPVASGCAALLCQWGIIMGNDRFMYGEKVKASFLRGARQLPGEKTPSPKTGWGALCLFDSIPGKI